jgi:Cys-tRNA(Pro)/Cys-tRNA(Cys) deacylase
MSKVRTRAISHLQRLAIDFTVHAYEVGETELSYGEAVAMEVGVSPERLFKTLVAKVDDRPVVGIDPVSGQLSLKNLAKAVGGKRAVMAESADAQRLTGYVVGGISPIGQTRRLPMVIDSSIRLHRTVLVSAGQRGLQLEMTPDDLMEATDATVADIAG